MFMLFFYLEFKIIILYFFQKLYYIIKYFNIFVRFFQHINIIYILTKYDILKILNFVLEAVKTS